MAGESRYVGTELELFARATTWKRYWQSLASPFVQGDVLEVGAGLGGNLALLSRAAVRRWVGLEPDRALCERLQQEVGLVDGPARCHVINGTVADLPMGEVFDAILYVDVLEHVADDRSEVARAVVHLRPGGVLVILVPAHPRLYTAFDAAIGHHRRYTKNTLIRTVPRELEPERLLYLDSVGLIASCVNRCVLGQAMPTAEHIALWDRVLVRLSKAVDPILRYSVGKSLLGIWRTPSRPTGARCVFDAQL